eukprot:693736-Heterocapsa_arctica.AAC.1
MKRLPEDKRWDSALVLSVKGTPWAPVDGATTAPVPVAVYIPVSEGNLPPVADLDPTVQIRAMKIMKKDLELHGYSDGCRGCHAIRRGATGIPHSAECRTRIETAMQTTPTGADRVRQSGERRRAH